jgi:hypothetical protein
LPETSDEDYQSMETLLRHLLRAARGYMAWMCEKLNLPDPKIDPVPAADVIEAIADEYLEHLLERWRLPLAGIEEEKFYNPAFTSRWGSEYCIEGMLEHAVVHPLRHEFQLRNLIADKQSGDK